MPVISALLRAWKDNSDISASERCINLAICCRNSLYGGAFIMVYPVRQPASLVNTHYSGAFGPHIYYCAHGWKKEVMPRARQEVDDFAVE